MTPRNYQNSYNQSDYKYLGIGCLLLFVSITIFKTGLPLAPKNFLLMCFGVILSPILLIFTNYKKADKITLLLVVLLFGSILALNPLRPGPQDWGSAAFKCFYVIVFTCLAISTPKFVKAESFQRVIKYIIYAFAIESTLQFISSKIGLSISLNQSPFLDRTSGFATEPSIGTTVSCFLYLNLWKLKQITKRVENEKIDWPYFCLFVIVLFAKSVYGLSFVAAITFITRKRWIPFILALSLLASPFILSKITEGENSPFARIARILKMQNILELSEIDDSASYRILPLIFVVEKLELSTESFIGHGSKSASKFLRILMLSAGEDNDNFAGVWPNFLYDYGIIAMSIFIALLIRCFRYRSSILEPIMAVYAFANGDFATQMVWFIFAISAISSAYRDHADESELTAESTQECTRTANLL